MSELKPEDVMRALECCTRGRKHKDDRPCLECPYNFCNIVGGTDERQVSGTCQGWMMKDALALLREKDAEIERLKEHQDTVTIVCERAKEHYHNLYENAKELFKATARAEAITEFAERLKKTLIASGIYPVIVKNSIEKIAKELKGETDGKSDL